MLEEKVKIKKYSTISFNEFEEKYNSKKLGKLYLPNGPCTYDSISAGITTGLNSNDMPHLRLDLYSLFDVLTGKNSGSSDISSEDFLGMIVYGDSIKFPGYKVIKKNNAGFLRSFFNHNEEDKLIPLKPTYAKFLVIVRDKILMEYSEGGERVEKLYTHHDSATKKILVDGKIKINYIPLADVRSNLKSQDPDMIKIFQRGIPLINGSGIFSRLYSDYSIEPTNPRKMNWDNDSKDLLNCYIK